MAQNVDQVQHKKELKREKRLCRYEKAFARHKYNGYGKSFFKEISGSSDIILFAPLSVNNNNKIANKYSGALARLLAYETGCRTLFASKNFKAGEASNAKLQYEAIIHSRETKVIVELRTHVSASNEIIITAAGEYREFLKRLALYTIQYEYRDIGRESFVKEASLGISHIFETDNDTSEPINADTDISTLVVDIPEGILNRHENSCFGHAYSALKNIVVLLNCLDWATDNFFVYRLWQANSKSQIPQDKVEFVKTKDVFFKENAFIHVCSSEGIQETARINKINKNTVSELNDFLKKHDCGDKDDYVILTNRLIEMIFGREWFEGTEELPGLRGAPVIIYENRRDRYEIGIPKANQVNSIALSTKLYKEKMELSSKYDYLVFNSYSDSRIYIDVEKSDYQDNGRVKSKEGTPNAEKVMMPRYYRLMMGYLEKPLKTIRAEEYTNIIQNIPKKNELIENAEGQQEMKYEITEEDFIRCYQKMPGQAYFQLIEQSEVIFEEEKNLYDDSIERITKYLEKIGAYSHVDLIRIPKKVKPKTNLLTRIRNFRKNLWIKMLKKTIGRSEYVLKTSWAGDTDDKNNIARLNSNMMSLIGVSENDKILIRFGDNTTILRVLPKDDLTDYEIGIPSSGRRALKMNSMNDIVIVHRDMEHTFKRHSQEQTIAILGTVLAVAQVLATFEIFTKSLLGIAGAIVVCIVAIVLMLYFALSEERVKVK